ncbi:unnamed protein product [Lymnaea stagnalis]|uniref:Uncharacterized protein n=1 Tax=Lymnaea stagnalis TaxID=6523 RepID=A0AAV2HNG2_LYMST
MNEPYCIKKYFALKDMCKITCFLVIILPLLTTLTFAPVSCALTLRNADDQPTTFAGQKTLGDSIRYKRDEAEVIKNPRSSAVDSVNEGTKKDDKANKATENDENNKKPEISVNCSLPINTNNSNCAENKEMDKDFPKSILSQMKENKEMLLRTLYVTLGVTGIVVVYFIIRAVRLRRKRTKSRKYGIITQQGDRGDMEMEPLGDGDDDEEDYTVFEVNGRKK